jgi:serine/threonine-protein kinase
VIGTAQYLSPEQARGEAVDARSDVYAAGCVLFELLVGHPPFVGDSPVSVAYQHVREDPRAPSDVNPEVPRDVDAIVLKALAKNPMNRYQSSQEMRADALRAVSGRPVLATPVMNQVETMAMEGPPQWQPQGATTIQRPIPGGPPRPPQRRSSTWVMAVLAALGVLVVVVLAVALVKAREKDNTEGQQQAAVKTMPNLIGKTDDQAVQLLEGQNLRNITRETPKTDASCEGKVDQQDPKANTKVNENDTVSYRICLPPEQVTVPDDLKGATKDNADQRLRAINLVPKFVDESSDRAVGTVTSVEKAGNKVDPGTEITVRISNGKKVKMPNVVDKPLETAKAILEERGQFNVTTVEKVDPTREPGTVIAQNPKANASVEKGDEVTLTVAAAQPDPSGSPSPDDTATPPGGIGGGTALGKALAIVRRED